MRASELRKIYESSQNDNAIKFWEVFQSTLFDYLSIRASCRKDSITIGYNDKLAEGLNGENWVGSKSLRDKVQIETEKLGYEFIFIEDHQGDHVILKW